MFFCRIPEPPYTIIQEPPTGHPDFLVAEIHLPKLVSITSGLIVFVPLHDCKMSLMACAFRLLSESCSEHDFRHR